MSGPGFKRKGAAQTRKYLASQNVEVSEGNEEVELNLTEGSNPSVKRRIMLTSSPPRSPITRSRIMLTSSPPKSPITRSQTRSAQPSPVGRTSKLRSMIARSPNANDGHADEVRTPISTSMQRTNETIVGENSTPECGPTPTSDEQGSAQSKKIRGPTRGIGLEKLTKSKGKKLAINVSPSKGRPIDPTESAKLSSEIGLMVRHHLPMNTKFKDITEGVIEESLSRVEARFDIDLSKPHVKRVALGIMKDRNRGQRCKLYKLFKTFQSTEDARKNPPNNIDIAKWTEMCDYWTSPKFIHRSEVNKKNRGNNAIHSGGSKPFVVHHSEKGDPIEVYKSTHQKKETNDWIQPENEAAYNEMKLLESECTSETNAESGNFDNNDKREIMTRVLGKKAGRLIGFGLGTRAEKSSSINKEKVALAAELEASHKKNEELEATIQAQGKRMDNLENLLNKLADNPQFLQLIQGNSNSVTERDGNNS